MLTLSGTTAFYARPDDCPIGSKCLSWTIPDPTVLLISVQLALVGHQPRPVAPWPSRGFHRKMRTPLPADMFCWCTLLPALTSTSFSFLR